jgi:hypothetical protein
MIAISIFLHFIICKTNIISKIYMIEIVFVKFLSTKFQGFVLPFLRTNVEIAGLTRAIESISPTFWTQLLLYKSFIRRFFVLTVYVSTFWSQEYWHDSCTQKVGKINPWSQMLRGQKNSTKGMNQNSHTILTSFKCASIFITALFVQK